MGAEDRTDDAAQFMLAEYQDLYQNVIHMENSLFSHLSFYTTLFMGIVTASVAILQMAGGGSALLAQPGVPGLLAVLFFLFAVVGRFELRMTTELRIRKMKFVEGITQIRQYFTNKDKAIRDYLVLPVGLQEAPPYLRVRSADWYQVIYISLMNGFSVVIGWLFLGACVGQVIRSRLGTTAIVVLAIVWCVLGVVFFYLVFWVISYRNTVDFCASYDKRRKDVMGEESRYDLFERPLPKSRLQWTFGDWIRWFEQRREARERRSSN